MSLFEFYNMHIPLFIPSKKLLADYHAKYDLLCERTWECIHGKKVSRSQLPRHPDSTSIITNYDPNDDVHPEALMEWIQFADFYLWPHILLFDSLDHLVELMRTTDLAAVSRGMAEFSVKQQQGILHRWEEILEMIRRGKYERRKAAVSTIPNNVDDALSTAYGVRRGSNCFDYSYV